MNTFSKVVIAAAIVGGFVGGELMDRTFSIAGAVIGGIGVAAVLVGLRAYCDSQERRGRKMFLPSGVQKAFDRVFDREPQQTSSAAQEVVSPLASDGDRETDRRYCETMRVFLGGQLGGKQASLKNSFGWLMTNKRAAGYVFGFHDAYLETDDAVDVTKGSRHVALIEKSYRHIFGEQAGATLLWMSLASLGTVDFQEGRLSAANDVSGWPKMGVMPFGLWRIRMQEMRGNAS